MSRRPSAKSTATVELWCVFQASLVSDTAADGIHAAGQAAPSDDAANTAADGAVVRAAVMGADKKYMEKAATCRQPAHSVSAIRLSST